MIRSFFFLKIDYYKKNIFVKFSPLSAPYVWESVSDITSSGAFSHRICTLLVITCCSGTGRCDYRWTKPFVKRTDHQIWTAASGISITMPDTNELSFSRTRTINICTRVLENWISSDHRWREAGYWMYYIMRTCSIKPREYVEVCNKHYAARVAMICDFACWLADYILLHVYTYVCQEVYKNVKIKMTLIK